MATPQTIARMTADEFEAFAEGERARDRPGDLELVKGVVVEGEMPNRRHQMILRAVDELLAPWAEERGGGTWTNAELRLSRHDVRQADLIAWWSGQSVPLDSMMLEPPDLVVEVMSPRPRDVRRDREEKLVEYARFGVPHYWVLEPIHQV